MKARDLKSCRKALSVWAVVLLICLFFPFLAKASIPEKYGVKDYNYVSVKFSVKSTPVKRYDFKLPDITYVHYNYDGTITWDWGYVGEGDFLRVKGKRIDSEGSFSVNVKDVIGKLYYPHVSQTSWCGANYNVYPMMQFDGMNILLTDCDEIIFKVSSNEMIHIECNTGNIPSEAKIGFGPIQTDYYYHNYYENYGDPLQGCTRFKDGEDYPYGPFWQMLLDFSMKPLYPNQDSIDEIIDDAAETDTPIYDIFGKRMETDKNSLTPGIYIYRGQKILVK